MIKIMSEETFSKPLQKILFELTGERRLHVALNLAIKNLVRLKLQEGEHQVTKFENRYGMSFEQFQQAWENDQIADKHSYALEKDYWEWEALMTDLARFSEMLEELS